MYSPPKPVFKNQTSHKENTIHFHCSFVEVFTRIEAENIDFSILDDINKFRARLDFADNEASSKLDSHNLGELWKTLAQELHSLAHHLRLIDFNGKWELHLLFEEYYAFNQAKLATRSNSPPLMMSNLIRVLNSLLGMSDEISGSILEGLKVNSQVRKLLYLKEKKLSNTIKQSGILQHGLRFIFGDTWVRQRKYELKLVQEGVELSEEIGHILAKFELIFKLYSETGKLLLASIDRVMQQPQPTKTIWSLVMLFSIFKCNHKATILFQYVGVEAPMSLDP
ncbi:hypothetical protein PCANC_10732 [Puccinia coronata f. sp. avenae]|uniref:Uncharacterized protein n=1 Tax=Puccinia coronata f. sp. avenae TaxID=200324 RepID=A0A2N5VSQ9_9BASI|nr:hypothetical protein PCANC_10732 [Puccinia coronata f. sp. avenae]